MSKERTSLTPRLFWPLLVIPPLGHGLLNLPFFASHAMGANGYLGVPIAAVMILPGLGAIHLLARRFPGQTLTEQGVSILGGILGRATGAAYLAANLILLVVFARDLVDMVLGTFLGSTPLFVALLLFVLVEAYLASRGIETIARTASFMLLPVLLIMLAMILIGLRNVTVTHLLPLASPTAKEYLAGG